MATRNATAQTSTPRSSGRGGLAATIALFAETVVYRFSWPKLLSSNLVLSIALLVSITLNVILFQAYRNMDPTYFATTAGGRLIQLIPLSQPLVPPEKVVQFAQDCVTRTFTLTFVEKDLREHLNSLRGVQGCYTEEGYKSLMADKGFSDLIEKIISRKLVASSVATGAGIIASESPPKAPIHRWVVQQPISITLVNQTERKSYSFIIETNIQRIPIVDSPEGIATSSIRFIGNGQNN